MRVKRLSICIPTFNRIRYLRELLPNLVSEVEPCSDAVELLVSDNASTDGTSNLVSDLIARHPFVRLVRNAENVGANRNFWRCIEEAAGEFVWLFGDDDLFVPGSVRKVVRALENPTVDLVICLSESGKPERHYCDYRAAVDGEGKTYPEFALEHTLITCNVFRKSKFRFDLARRYLFTQYSQMFGLRDAFRGGVHVFPEVVAMREWSDQAQPFFYFLSFKQGVYLLWLAFQVRSLKVFLLGLSRVLEIFKDINRIRRRRRKLRKLKKTTKECLDADRCCRVEEANAKRKG